MDGNQKREEFTQRWLEAEPSVSAYVALMRPEDNRDPEPANASAATIVSNVSGLSTGQISLAVFVYLEDPARNGVVATNFDGERGNFNLSLDENAMLQATIRSSDGDVNVVAGKSTLPLKTWRHIVMTADGENLQLYEDGKIVASKPCAALAATASEAVWFGTDARANQVWGGRIDELALFDRALNEEEIAALYRTAQEELARSQ